MVLRSLISFLESAFDLHSDDGVDEEEHTDQEDDVGQRLERLHERPQQDPDRLALTKQLYETGGAKQSEEADVDEILLKFCYIICFVLKCENSLFVLNDLCRTPTARCGAE